MGFLDNLIGDIQSGELDKRLGQFADAVERVSEKAVSGVEKLADAPAKALGAAEAKKDQIEQNVVQTQFQAGRTVDAIKTTD